MNAVRDRMKLLVVDDESQVLAALEDLLEDHFEVLTATSGGAGIKILENEDDISVVLTDERMPKLRGHEFLAQVKDISDATRVLMTGFTDIEAVIKAVNDGQIFGYIAKPWNPDAIRFLIFKARERYELLHELNREKELLRYLMDNSPDAVYFKDQDLRYLRLNQMEADRLGVREMNDILGKRLPDIKCALLNGDIEARELEVINKGVPIVDDLMEIDIPKHRWYANTLVPMLDKTGDAHGLVGMARDVTFRSLAQQRGALIANVSQSLSETRDIQKALAVALQHFCIAGQWACGQGWLVDEVGQTLKCVVGWSRDQAQYADIDELSVTLAYGPKQKLLGKAWQETREAWVADTGSVSPAKDRLSGYLTKHKLKKALCVPIVDSAGRVLAVFCGFKIQYNEKDQHLTEIVADVANQVGVQFERIVISDALSRNEQQLRSLATNLPGMIFQLVRRPSARDEFIYMSDGINSLLGLKAGEVMRDASLFSRLVVDEDMSILQQALTTSADSLDPLDIEFRVESRNDELLWLELRAAPRKMSDGGIVWDGMVLNITERKVAEARLEFLAQFDPVTGLPNRARVADRLTRWMRNNKDAVLKFAVASIHVDQFKFVAESYGYAAIDMMMATLAQVLRDKYTDSAEFGRIGENELLVVISHRNMHELNDELSSLQSDLHITFDYDSHATTLTTSMGVAITPTDGTDAESLIKNAGVARNRAHLAGVSSFQFYKPEMNTVASERLELETRLRDALKRDELVLFYQPQVRVTDGSIVGFEALIRWPDGKGGMISPAEFIPVAEESGLIVEIGEWVLRTACKQLAAWNRMGLPKLEVAINISGRHCNQPEFVQLVKSTLEEHGIAAAQLKLEITESALMSDLEKAIKMMEGVTRLGVGIAIDDFGTGYSSLSYLSKFPATTLKIDRAFVMDMATNSKNAAIVAAAVTIAHGLGMNVVAEGVEEQDQVTFLKAYRCDVIQGYLFHRPMPVAEIEKLFQKQ